MMLACDLVIAAQRTVFNAGFTSHALVPDAGATFFLPRKVGAARALELLMLNEDISAEKAEQWGLINRVVADASLQEEGLALVEKLAAGATRILGATKKLVCSGFDKDLNGQLALESAASTALSKSFDFREAMNAYAGKREAKFTGA